MRKTIIFLVFFAITAVTGVAENIQLIKVEGNARVEKETVQSYLPFREGQKFQAFHISQAIKSLYATGLFDEVNARWDGKNIVVSVVENPLVNRVVFEGNDEINKKQLEKVIQLKARSIFTPAKAQRDVQELLAAYRQRGRFLATVKPQIIRRDQNRVDVIYNINEGEKTRIQNIGFVGNKRFDDADLQKVILTKESAWWKFLTSSDTYDPDRLDVDKELLRRYYLQHGYADFQVISAVAELSRDKKNFFITFTVSEGQKYDFGLIDVVVNADDKSLKKEELLQEVSLASGELYNALRVEKNIDTLIDFLGNKGFAFLDVTPVFEQNEAERLVDVIFEINPGPRVYVNRINVEGNTRTRDEVVRREMRLAEGDAFSVNKLKRSKDRLNRLGYFGKVDIKRAETDQPDRVDLTVAVEEQSTGEFNVGAGVSTFEGLLATADVRERNFLGKGQEVAVKFAFSGKRQDYNLSFTEPYFLGQELSAGVDLFNQQTDFQDESSYDLDNTGGALRLGFPVDEFSRNVMRLGFKETKISNVGSASSQFVKREAGKRSSLSLSNTYITDTRDSRLTPTRGYRISATIEGSGIASDVTYLRGLLNASWHKELAEDFVLSLGGRVGVINDLGEDLPIYEHFSGGGTNLRGFAIKGIGPRDKTTDDALGGMYMLGNNIELSFPLPGLSDMGMKGILFSDGGIVTEFEGATDAVTDSDTYRISAGAGIFWQSPVGPIRLDFGVPVVKASEDKSEFFSFNIGSRF